MQNVSKEEFIDWMNHPVTVAMREGMLELAKMRKLNLAESCGMDSGFDREEKGYCKGLMEAWDHKQILEDLFVEENDEPSSSRA
jgi:hypothetical protein